jgi:thiol-disulfide isomerase/thioredoxin
LANVIALMKRFLFFLIFFSILTVGAFAQVKLMNLEQLQKRISNKDTVYVVNFWATWCSPCVAELPNFGKLQAAYQNQPLKVLLVSLDFMSKQKVVNKFLQANPVPGTEIFMANRKKDEDFILGINKAWSGALPATLIINAKKEVRLFREGALTYEELNKLYQTHK